MMLTLIVASVLSQASIDCIARVIYHEARGESELGQRAVASVVRNRMNHPDFPNTACEVVHQPRQFVARGAVHGPAWLRALEIASEREWVDVSNGALYFHTRASYLPGQVTARIGGHVFKK